MRGEKNILPKEMFDIDIGVFRASSVEEIIFPEGLTRINYEMAHSAAKLKRVVIPEGVIVIGRNAFSCCDQLEEVILPSTLLRIEAEAFLQCPNLRLRLLLGPGFPVLFSHKQKIANRFKN